MASTWGPFSKRARIGIDVAMSPATVGPATSSVTLTWSVYLRTTYAYAGTYGLQRTGTGPTGPTNVTFSTQNCQTTTVLLWTGTQSVSTSYTGTVSRSMTATLPASGTLFDGAKPTHARSITVPIRPPSAPSAPTSATATMNGAGTQATVTIVRPANYSSNATRWANWRVQRRTDGGAYTWVAARLSPAGTTWVDSSVQPGHTYTYRAASINVTGTSAFATTSTVSTVPSVPTGVSASMSGGEISVNFSHPGGSGVTFELWSEAEGAVVDTGSSSPLVDGDPDPMVTNRYRVRALAGALQSAWSAWSNSVTILAPPAAPTSLHPNGSSVAHEDATVLSWLHVPTDTTGQTARQVRHRTVGSGPSWSSDSGKVNTASQQMTVGAGGFGAPGVGREWQVRTWGEHEDPSEWSASAFITVQYKPVVTITGPVEDINSRSTTVTWSTFQASGLPQAGWQVTIRDGGTVLYTTGAQSGGATSWTSPDILPETDDLSIWVRVSAGGIWSDWGSVTRTVEYIPPAEPNLDVEWVAETASVSIVVSSVSEEGLPESVSLRVERSTTGEDGPWVTLVEVDAGLDVAFMDPTPPLSGPLHYRALAVSALPSEAETVEAVTTPHDAGDHSHCGIWINSGPGLMVPLFLPWDPALTESTAREGGLGRFDDRPFPVPLDSMHVSREISVTASFLPDSHPSTLAPEAVGNRERVRDLALTIGHFYRDPDGEAFHARVSGVSFNRPPGDAVKAVSFQVTEVDVPTDEQNAAQAGYRPPQIVMIRPGEYGIVGGGGLTGTLPGEYILVDI